MEKQSKEANNAKRAATPKSHSESDLEQKGQNNLNVESDKVKPSGAQSESESRVKVSFELKENSRVRIASLVENLETKECLPLNNSNNSKSKSDEEQIGRKPVVQIVPAVRNTNANRFSVNKRDESSESVGSNAAESQSAVPNAVPVIQANPVNIRPLCLVQPYFLTRFVSFVILDSSGFESTRETPTTHPIVAKRLESR